MLQLRQHPALKDGLFSQGVVALVIKMASAALSFLMFAGIARSLDQAGFGLIGTAFSLATIAAAVGSMGQRVTAIRLVAAYDEQGRAAERSGLMRFSYVVLASGTLVAGILAVIWVRRQSEVPTNLPFLLGIVALSLALGIADLQSRVLRPISGIVLTLLPKDVVWRLGIFLVGIFTVVSGATNGLSPTGWLWVMAVSLFAVIIVQFSAFDRLHRPQSPIRGAVKYRVREWSAESIAPWFAIIVITGGPSLAVVLVGTTLSLETSGPFFATVRIAQLLALFMLAIEVVLSPNISRDIVAGRFDKLQDSCRTSAILGAGFAFGGWLVFVVAGDVVLNVFRDGFGVEHKALVIISFAYLVNTAAGPTAPLLLMSGRAKELARYQMISWSIGLAALIPAIRAFGTIGAAICLAAADIAWNLAAWRSIRKTMGIEPTVLSVISTPSPIDWRDESVGADRES